MTLYSNRQGCVLCMLGAAMAAASRMSRCSVGSCRLDTWALLPLVLLLQCGHLEAGGAAGRSPDSRGRSAVGQSVGAVSSTTVPWGSLSVSRTVPPRAWARSVRLRRPLLRVLEPMPMPSSQMRAMTCPEPTVTSTFVWVAWAWRTMLDSDSRMVARICGRTVAGTTVSIGPVQISWGRQPSGSAYSATRACMSPHSELASGGCWSSRIAARRSWMVVSMSSTALLMLRAGQSVHALELQTGGEQALDHHVV